MTTREFNQRVAVGAQVVCDIDGVFVFMRTRLEARDLLTFSLVPLEPAGAWDVDKVHPLWFGEECDD